MYIAGVEVSTSALRAELAAWLRRAAAGEEVVITDRGIPVARLAPVGTTSVIERLIAEGVVSRAPSAQRPTARGSVRARATEPVSELVSDQRR